MKAKVTGHRDNVWERAALISGGVHLFVCSRCSYTERCLECLEGCSEVAANLKNIKAEEGK